MDRNIANKRWKFLKQCILKKKIIDNNDLEHFSVRRFSTFNLFEITENDNASVYSEKWYNYSCTAFPLCSLQIKTVEDTINTKDLIGFNNTGNICIWPSEEVLAFYCLSNIEDFQGRNICELGGGMTCLAGLLIAQLCKTNMVLLTDGNERSIENLKSIINNNIENMQTSDVSCELMRWGENLPCERYHEYFDFIISADCLLFEDYQKSFLQLIEYLMKPQGLVIIFAPLRGKSFDNFILKASQKFKVIQNSTDYNGQVLAIHQQNIKKGIEFYDENIHLPRLLLLERK